MGVLLFLAIFLPTCFGISLLISNRGMQKFAGLLSSFVTFTSFICIFFIYHDLEVGRALSLSIPWVPSLNVNLAFLIDGLSLFFGLLVTGVGTLVNLYAHYYMKGSDPYLKRFYLYLNLFTSAMLGCVFADHLIVLFLFWELTGVSSFLLIGYSFMDAPSIVSARLVFLVTSLTSLFLLVGILMLGNLCGTFLWSDIPLDCLGSKSHYALILCFTIGIFGKSAQIPFHFWLPRAMCAPTPISAYLHSATMVKLGVFLTARMFPIFIGSEFWPPLLTTVCLATMLLGVVLSLLSNDLKMILAYATVSQLGFFISMYGIGGVDKISYDFVHILNHAFYKGSLFMLVGIINQATGIRDIRELGGLFKSLPAVSLIFFIATLAMAGVPGTTGFISKDLVLNDLLLFKTKFWGPLMILILISSASIFKVAFSIRLFYHLFIRKKPNNTITVQKPVWQTLVPPGVLSLCALGFGIWPAGLEQIAESFYVAELHLKMLPSIQIWHGWTIGLMISFTILALGALLFYFAEKRQVWYQHHSFPDFGNGWIQMMEQALIVAKKASDFLMGRSVHRHLAILLLFFACGIGGILLFDGRAPWNGNLTLPLNIYRLTTVIMIVSTTAAVALLSGSLSQVLSLAASGFFVTLYFVFYQAPDLAMTQILIEVVTGMMLLVMAWVFRNERPVKEAKKRKALRLFVSALFAVAAAAITLSYSTLQTPRPLKEYFLASSLTLADGANAVNTILVDFRGLDTLGEITVLLIAAIAIVGLTSRKKSAEICWESKISLVPSPILHALTPPLFVIIHLFAFYLLIRGHNAPGGGFIAGLASSIAYILVGLSFQLTVIKRWMPVNLLMLSTSGILLAVAVSLFPTFLGKAILSHSFPSALIFDVAVFIVVLGITLISIFALRTDAFKEEGPYGN